MKPGTCKALFHVNKACGFDMKYFRSRDQRGEKDPLLSKEPLRADAERRLQVSHDSGDVDNENLKMHTYANLSHRDVAKVNKRAMHPVT